MNIFNIGTDLIEVKRIKRVIKRYPAFLEKIYTDLEISYCTKKDKVLYECFASRFAAKEAVAKSLGQGIGKNVFFKEIIISNNTDGKPIVSLSGRTLLYVTTLNIKEIKLSITSTKMYCIAFAVSLYA
ncbi:MAG: holo-ACP synthase [Actinomycetota bacterium]|nr:holo-ACP synthase [Actinomycetota bacterium]